MSGQGAVNRIQEIQNGEEQIKLLRSRTQVYRTASSIMVVQLILTLGIPITGGLLGAILPDVRPYFAAGSLAVIVLDSLLLDRYQKVLLKRAAKIGEQFDCTVLDLPWNQFVVGDKVEAEDIHAAARVFAAHHGDQELKGWYPAAVSKAPLHLARIICQRTNLRYDSRLRRSYGMLLLILSLTLITGLVVLGLVQNSSLTSWVLTLAFATPFLAWAAREYYRQMDAASSQDALMKEVRKLWNSALASHSSTDICSIRSRGLQDAIYDRRANSPLVIPGLYRFKRLRLEDEMNEGAADFLREYDGREVSETNADS